MSSRKILIIGGVAAGAGAATKAARTDRQAQVTMMEKGPYISYGACGLPYYVSGDIKNRGSLVIRRPEDLEKQYGMRVMVNTEALEILRPSKKVRFARLEDGTTGEIEYDRLIIATGADTLIPPIPGIDAPNVFTLRTLPDGDRIVEFMEREKPSRAVVIGGGYIGVEAADALFRRGLHTTLVEMLPQVLPPLDPDMAALFQEAMQKRGVNVITGDQVEKIETDSRGLACRVMTRSGRGIDTGMLIAAAGVRPSLKLARDAGLEIGKHGIVVDDYMRTSDPDIFAAGDVVQVRHMVTGRDTWSPLAGPANLQGKIAGGNAAGESVRYRGVLRTSIVDFSGFTAARTGLSEAEARQEGIEYESVIVDSHSHAGYYPGAEPIRIKILVKKQTGQVIGAQVAGGKGVDKRIDVLATAIYAKLTASDLESLDLAYSPQFSNSLDPVNVAGTVAMKKLGNE
jgi:NADPH-dependent 2,4-dienoyl-CoA reductase/sulfur reductase-like enzyme